MIPVQAVPEPASFDRAVRQKGLNAIAELTGAPASKRPGPRRRKRYPRPEDIPASELPDTWTQALPELRRRYREMCAYTAMFICDVTGAESVDHWIPKSERWDLAYEWSNLRLCTSRINAKKGTRKGLVDPFVVGDGWFALNLLTGEVIAGPGAPPARLAAIERTISADGLDLNRKAFCARREKHIEEYLRGVPLWHLEQHSPFVARELRRQGWLRPQDVLASAAAGHGRATGLTRRGRPRRSARGGARWGRAGSAR
ncbi:MAG: hypothetical protein R3B48_05090 [Kofleriaceae bacterium]